MVKFLTTALGGLTALTVLGLSTPSGQAMLGIHQSQPAVPVSVISDPGPARAALPVAAPVSTTPAPVPVAAPAPEVVRHAAAPVTRAPAPAAPVAHPAPVYRPAATRPVYHPTAASAPVHSPIPAAAPGSGIPMGGAGAITNILLNLPQVLQQGGQPQQYGPAPEGRPAAVPDNGRWAPRQERGHRDRWRRGGGDQQRNDGGDAER